MNLQLDFEGLKNGIGIQKDKIDAILVHFIQIDNKQIENLKELV